MLFNSIEFLFLFLPITLVVFFAIGKFNHRGAITSLVLASLFYYAYWKPSYLLIIIGSIFFNYIFGQLLSKKPQKNILAFGVTVNLLTLGYYKYTNFLVDNINWFFSLNLEVQKVVLPLAISFFTFQQIAFLVDSYQGKTKEYNFEKYVLFVAFFPQLIAGPIVHHKDVLPQFAKPSVYKVHYKNILMGLSLFSIGLFKKIIIADNLSIFANKIFDTDFNLPHNLNILTAWAGALSYTFQLYFDFSGYSDMAIGLAKMFNINIQFNFDSPYKSKSISEFWRRWHITLSQFLKDYLYIPLGGSRAGSFNTYRNLLITMILGGIWHGAGWNFAIWGTLHGSLLVINHIWKDKNLAILKNNKYFGSIFTLITMIAVVVGWVFFRSKTFHGAININILLFDFNWLIHNPILTTLKNEIGYFNLSMLICLIILVKIAPNAQQIVFKDITDRSELRFNNYYFLVFVSSLLAYSLYTIVYSTNKVFEFLYFDF